MTQTALLPLYWCLGAFLAGSIPFGLLVVRLAGKGDVRRSGSGNIGATNVMRTGGKALGLATLLLDVLKGFLPVYLAGRAFAGDPTLPVVLSFVALAAVLGHMFTPWLRFEGGKGVATALGAVLAFHAPMVLPALGTFLVLVLVFRYVSLGSVAAALVLLLTVCGFLGAWAAPARLAPDPGRLVILAWVLLTGMVIRKHGANLARLMKGTESRLWGGRPKERADV
jgi:acyl phosphate:glycerol-3-phosphate acyltransferase